MPRKRADEQNIALPTPLLPIRDRAVTLQDIAERCGVCKMTVSRAIRHDPRISAATTARVQHVAAVLGYDPSHQQAARRLALRKHGQDIVNHVIGLFLPPSFHQANYFISIFRGLLDVLTEEKFGLLTLYAQRDETSGEFLLPSLFNSGNLDGVVLVELPETGESLFRRLRDNIGFGKRPIVSVRSYVPGCSSVVPSIGEGAYAATRHLLELGHRHLLQFYAGWGDVAAENGRLAMVQRAMAEYGVDPATHLHLLRIDSLAWLDPATLMTTVSSELPLETPDKNQHFTFPEYLSAHPEITAVMAVNDTNALRLWMSLKQLGLRVPDDISLVGFDDTDPMPDDCGRNQLTSVRLPLVEMGREAAALILQQIRAKAANETQIVLPTELVLRASTAPVCAKREGR